MLPYRMDSLTKLSHITVRANLEASEEDRMPDKEVLGQVCALYQNASHTTQPSVQIRCCKSPIVLGDGSVRLIVPEHSSLQEWTQRPMRFHAFCTC